MPMISRRALLAAPAAATVAAAYGLTTARPAVASAGIYELVTEFRAANGVAPLVRDTGLEAVAAGWTQWMQATDSLVHNPSYADEIPGGWIRAGENIAWNYSEQDLFWAWVNSPGHRANLLDDRYTSVGIWTVWGPDGRVWATQDFATYPWVGPQASIGCFAYRTDWDSAAYRWLGSSVSSQVDLGGVLRGQPTVVRRGGYLEVYCRGSNRQLYVRAQQPSGLWWPWQSLGDAVYTTAPAAIELDGMVHLFARDPQGGLVWIPSPAPGQTLSPVPLGGFVLGGAAPGVALDRGRIVIGVIGRNNGLYTYTLGDGVFVARGASANGVCGLTVDDRSYFVVRGTDDVAYFCDPDGQWGSLGGRIIAAPRAAMTSAGLPAVFAIGGNGQWYSLRFGLSGWALAF